MSAARLLCSPARRGVRSLAIGLVFCASSVAWGQLTDQQLFDDRHLLTIEIDLPEQDWEQLRRQQRHRGGFMPFFPAGAEKPFTYFQGDLKIDGKLIRSVGIRKKGFIGSLDETRPSLKIKFDAFIEQEPIQGLDRLTLNNNKQDTALVSQILSYRTFREAGLHAPRCSFARVIVNGEDLGVYSNVESYRPALLRSRFGNDQGQLFEGTLADFYPPATSQMEAKQKEVDRRDVEALAKLLEPAPPLDLAALEQLVDVDAFLKFWAVESLLGFWDGYTQNQNNYFVYDNPANGRFYFMPWGADSCFTARGGFRRSTSSAAVGATAMLPNRLYHTPGIPARYQQAMMEVLQDAWDEQALIDAIGRYEALVSEHLHPNQRSDSGRSGWGRRRTTREDVISFIRGRRDTILSDFETGRAEVDAEPSKPAYTVPLGTVRGSLQMNSEVNAGEATEFTITWVGEEPSTSEASATLRSQRRFGFGRGRDRSPQGISEMQIRTKGTEPLSIRFNVPLDQLLRDKAVLSVTGMVTQGEPGFGFGFRPPATFARGELRSSINDGQLAVDFELEIVELRGGIMERMTRGRRR